MVHPTHRKRSAPPVSNQPSAPITIIGAGIVGVSTALWLQRAGARVTLIDRTGPAAGASFGNGGVLASGACVPVTVPGLVRKAPSMLFDRYAPLFLKYRYLPKLAPWLIKYLSHCNEADVRRIAQALITVVGDSLADHQALAAGTGAERWIIPSDYLYLYKNRAAYEGDAFGWSVRRDNGVEFLELEGDEIPAYDPAFSGGYDFAVRLPNHGRVADPGRYIADLADYFKAQGGSLETADITGLERQGDRVTALQTATGSIPVDRLIVTTGAWSGPLAKALGISVPLESERGYHLDLWNPSLMPKAPVMDAAGKFVITPMQDRIRLAGIVEFGGLKAAPSKAPFDLLRHGIKAAMPALTWERSEEWMGHRPAPADSIPIIGQAPRLENAWLGFGHHHVGLTSGPKTGWILAQMAMGQKTNLDLVPYSPMRFDTG